jgi:hypothetical protein
LTKNIGVIWKLPLSEFNTLEATSVPVSGMQCLGAVHCHIEHQVVGTERQTDVVQNAIDFIWRHLCANGALYQIRKLCRVLNACPCLRADVQGKLTAIGVGEEVLPEPGRQEKDAEAESKKPRNEDLAMRDETCQQTLVRTPNSS